MANGAARDNIPLVWIFRSSFFVLHSSFDLGAMKNEK
jgi:hypothetical protein